MLLGQINQFFRQLPAGAVRWPWFGERRVGGPWPGASCWWARADSRRPGAAAQSSGKPVSGLARWVTVAPPALGIAGLWIAAQLLSSALAWVRAVQAERVQDEVHRLIHTQALRLDLSFYDHPESYDQLHRARVDAISQPLALLESLGSLVQNGLGFLVLAGILWTYAGWLPLLLVAPQFPAASGGPSHSEGTPLAVGAHQSRAASPVPGLVNHGAEHRRRVAPLRSGNLPPQGLRELAREPPGRAVAPGAPGSRNRAGSRGPGLGRQPCGPGLDVAPDSRRKGRAGGPPALLHGLPAMPDAASVLLEGAGKIYRSLLFVENLDEYLGLEPAILPGPSKEQGLPVKDSIRFEGVSFTYPEHSTGL